MTDSSAMNEIPGPRPGGAGWLWLVFACAIAAYLPTAFVHTTWGNDESRIVEVARQMSEYDHPLVPHLRGEVYSEKPPALYWMISATHAVVGDWALAGHLVVAFFVALCGMVVAALGALLLESRRLGLVGGLVFLTLATVVMRAHFVLLDPVMTTWVLAAVLFLLLAARTGGRRRFGWALAAALASAGACMTKGPAAQLHIAMGTIVTGLVLSRRRSVAWGPLVFALAFGFGVTLLWVRLAANEVGPWFWDRMVLQQSSGRLGAEAPHARPVYYYLHALLTQYAPYTILLPAAFLASTSRESRSERGRAPLALFAWFGVGLVVFSLIGAKRPGYVLPLAAPIALLVTFGVHAGATSSRRLLRHLVRGPLTAIWVVAAVVGLGALALPFLPWSDVVARAPERVARWLPGLTLVDRVGLAAFGCLALAGAWRAWGWLRRGEFVRATAVFALILLISLGYTSFVVHRVLDPVRSARRFVEASMQEVGSNPGAELFQYPHAFQGRVPFYAGLERVEVLQRDGLAERAARPGVFYLITIERNWDPPPEIESQVEILIREPLGSRKYLLVRVVGAP